MGRATLRIEGMHCAHCALTIEKSILGVDGVHRASVSFAAKKAIVEYDERKTSLKAIRAAVESAGYKVKEQMVNFVRGGGKIFACGTCLRIRGLEGSEICPLSTLKDLYAIIRESDKIITF